MSVDEVVSFVEPGIGLTVWHVARDRATGVLAGGSDPRAEGLALGL